jgi:hypothetical protein
VRKKAGFPVWLQAAFSGASGKDRWSEKCFSGVFAMGCKRNMLNMIGKPLILPIC